MQAIKDELTVETKDLSATVRLKSSAQDSRPSAAAVGSLGIILIVIATVLIITPDVITLA